MWVAKIKLKDNNCIWSTRTKKWNVIDYQYPLRYKESEDGLFVTSYHLIDFTRTYMVIIVATIFFKCYSKYTYFLQRTLISYFLLFLNALQR